MAKPTILVLLRHYLPGYKAGGPLRTISNMVDQLGNEFEFRVITSDRDLSDDRPFDCVNVNRWNDVGAARVYYASPSAQRFLELARLVRSTPHQVLYLNSYFDPVFTASVLLARRLRLIPKRATVVAPRGEFSEGAIALKQSKKAAYSAIAKLAGLHDGLTWQASSDFELADIQRVIGAREDEIRIAPDLPARHDSMQSNGRCAAARRAGEALRICFIARISPKKNLDFALQVLGNVRSPVIFTVYGPREDDAYWERCQLLIERLPSSVSVRYEGAIEHRRVHEAFEAHDLFFFPTRGENYGHVILESMRAGTPVLIADTTPWRGLAAFGVGWDLPLNDAGSYVAAIEHACTIDEPSYNRWRERVREYAFRRSVDPSVVQANRVMFLDVISRPPR